MSRELFARIAEAAFDDRPRSRVGHPSQIDWDDGYLAGTRAAAAAIRAASSATREQGQPCPNCLKPVEVGQVVLPWDDHDPGEMHADCERPYRTDHVQEPGCPAPCVLIGDPMRQVPLAALASAREPIAGDAVAEIVELARRAIAREQTDFLGRMADSLCRYEGIFAYYPDGDLPADECAEAIDEISALAGLALAQLVLLRHPNDGTDPAAALAHPRPALDREAVEAREWSGVVANDPCQSADETDEDGNPCWYIEIQSIGGHSIIATIWGASPEQVQTRADAILALATPPAALERKAWTKNSAGVKDGAACYRTIDGVRWQWWAEDSARFKAAGVRCRTAPGGGAFVHPEDEAKAETALATPPARLPGESTNGGEA